MGCGKTTLGRAAAHSLSLRFIDLDEYIEERSGATVSEIFASRGEQEFRALEREALEEVSSLPDTIIATGGGTPCQPGLMDLMLERGNVVFLDVNEDRLHERLKQARSTRPLIARLDDDTLRAFIGENLARRTPFYSRATFTFDSSRLENEEQIKETVNRFKILISNG